MKTASIKLSISALFLFVFYNSHAQWSLSGNTISSGQFLGVNNNVILEFRRNSNQVMFFDENNNVAVGSNISISPEFSKSFAIGSDIQFIHQSEYFQYNYAIGNHIYSSGQNQGKSMIILGSGIDNANPLTAYREGLSVGFNSTIPTFFVGPANGINTTGNVGIATINPSQKLDINGGLKLGNTNIVSDGSLRFTGSDFEGYVGGSWKSLTATSGGGNWALNGANTYNTNSGHVGIGTSTPSGKLEVNGLSIFSNPTGTNYNENMRLPASTSGYSSIALGTAAGSVSGTGVGQWTILKYPAANNHTFSIRYNTSDFLTILSGGSVGIGTNTPTQSMEVKGNLALGNAVNGTRWVFESRSWAGGDYLIIAGDKTDGTYDWSKQVSIERATGKVAIGPNNMTTPGNYRLYVKDGILAEKVRVAIANSSDWADYVFAPGYKLKTLPEVEQFIKNNKHLPDVPSADQVVKDGVDMAEMDALLLQKIEELTLYVIEQNKRIEQLEAENKRLAK